MPQIGVCPNPECRAILADHRAVDAHYLTTVDNARVYSIVCSSCGVVVGTVSVPRG